MGLLGRIGIGTKVGIGSGFLIVLLLLITAVSYESLYAAKNDFFEYRHLARQNNALGRVQANMVEIRLHAKEYLLSGSDESVRLLRERADKLRPLIAEARALFDDREAFEVLTNVENDSRAYVNAFLKIVELSGGPAKGGGEASSASTSERDHLVHDVLDHLGPTIDASIESMKISNLARQDALGPRASADVARSATTAVAISLFAVVIGAAAAFVITAAISRPITAMTRAMRSLASGDLAVDIPARDHRDEIGAMAKAVHVFKEALHRLEEQRLQRAEVTGISTALQLAESPEAFGKALLDRLVPALGEGLGLLYIRDAASARFQVAGSYACDSENALKRCFLPGEGLPGQCVASGRTIVVTDFPDDSHIIGSGLTAGRPNLVACVPVSTQEGVLGVIEIARFGEFTELQREFLELVTPVVGLNLGLLVRNLKTTDLLEQTRVQAEELRAQTEELQASEDELRLQQEELQAANEALEEKTRSLEQQAAELEAARSDADLRAAELALSSQYKSQFLASMSHELRTPLNSILLLANALIEDQKVTLNQEQLESATMIAESGNHLLSLINNILDLSKIEAGKLEMTPENFHLDEALAYVERVFAAEASKKSILLSVNIAPSAPVTLFADRQRFTQVMINLVGNAVKFTDQGEVRISAERRDNGLCFSIHDTGIGIAADRIDHIFGAFQQLDGATSRRYGGTGLGLAICKSLVELMGGRIEVTSTPSVGSAFSVILPRERVEAFAGAAAEERPVRALARAADPANIEILVVAPDPHLQSLLRRLIGSLGYGFDSVPGGDAALAAIARNRPAGILLDVDIPDGLDVLRRLKAESDSAIIPIFVISSDSSVAGSAKTLGAMGRIIKPVIRDDIISALTTMIGGIAAAAAERRRVLVVEDNLPDALALEKLFRKDSVDLMVVQTGEEAMHRLTDGRFDAVILDLMLPDMSGFNLLERLCAEPGRHPPVIIYSAHDLNAEDIYHLRCYAESVVVKGRTQSRLREEVLQAIDGPAAGKDWATLTETPSRLQGRRLLLVDDDIRNLVALSKNLRVRGFEIEVASEGAKALDLLASGKFDAVLTDIMMPDMDGYELIRRIRAAHGELPVIAATAKAMKGDADLCLQAGANDYLAKPLDLDNLLEKLEQWIA
jgi:signal transduction histidine kinase/CheY-like chemotaxis protein/HAMP domain-containing protein